MEEFINEAFGTDFRISEYKKLNNLPVYMISNRVFYKAEDDSISFIIVEIRENNTNIQAIKNQKDKYENSFSMPIVFYFIDMNKSQRDSLIRNRIPFIYSNKQIYIPFIGMYLHNRFTNQKTINNEKMMPITQCLFLYMLYICKENKVIKKDAAKYLNVTKMSITRASEQLQSMNIVFQEKKGKETYMYTKVYGYELFNLAKMYLINPVQETITVNNTKQINDLPLANESALSKLTMLNKPRIQTLALYKSNIDKYKFNIIDEKWNESSDIVNIEKWKYDPNIFSKNNIIDPVSLYMSFETNKDERIEAELENMLKEKL